MKLRLIVSLIVCLSFVVKVFASEKSPHIPLYETPDVLHAAKTGERAAKAWARAARLALRANGFMEIANRKRTSEAFSEAFSAVKVASGAKKDAEMEQFFLLEARAALTRSEDDYNWDYNWARSAAFNIEPDSSYLKRMGPYWFDRIKEGQIKEKKTKEKDGTDIINALDMRYRRNEIGHRCPNNSFRLMAILEKVSKLPISEDGDPKRQELLREFEQKSEKCSRPLGIPAKEKWGFSGADRSVS